MGQGMASESGQEGDDPTPQHLGDLNRDEFQSIQEDNFK